MTWARRALVCAIGGMLLMLCGCRWQAWLLESGTATLYLLWIVTARE